MYTVYGKPNCKFCDMAKTLLEMKSLEFKYVDVTQSPEDMAMMRERGFRTVPQIFLGEELIGTFDNLKASLV